MRNNPYQQDTDDFMKEFRQVRRTATGMMAFAALIWAVVIIAAIVAVFLLLNYFGVI
jgi:hypothetical protein